MVPALDHPLAAPRPASRWVVGRLVTCPYGEHRVPLSARAGSGAGWATRSAPVGRWVTVPDRGRYPADLVEAPRHVHCHVHCHVRVVAVLAPRRRRPCFRPADVSAGTAGLRRARTARAAAARPPAQRTA